MEEEKTGSFKLPYESHINVFNCVPDYTHSKKEGFFEKKKWPDVIIHTFNASTGRQRQVIFTDSWTAWPTREFQVSQCFKDFDVFKHR